MNVVWFWVCNLQVERPGKSKGSVVVPGLIAPPLVFGPPGWTLEGSEDPRPGQRTMITIDDSIHVSVSLTLCVIQLPSYRDNR